LKANTCGHVDVEKELLHGLFYVFVRKAIVSDKGCQQRVEVGKGLSASSFTLQGVEEIDHLP